MIYAINKTDKTKEPTRKVTTDFFKEYLGFTDDDILFVDESEFDFDEDKFIAATQEAMKKFARPIFEDTKHSLAKQVLNIAIFEENCDFHNFSNFELNINVTEAFTLANATKYFYSLA